jgi:eukaryotic-like serine/threonine-protein kinase
MQVTLILTTGPHKGLAFSFTGHDTFLVGRSRHAHFRLPVNDKAFSRVHFMVEVNPPRCRLIDMGSHNGTYVNGQKVMSADLADGDQIRAGHTILAVRVEEDSSETLSFHPEVDSPYMPEVPGHVAMREIESGSRLFLAASNPGDELRAIRIIRPQQGGTPSQVARFLESTKVLLDLRHPNIARLCDRGSGKSWFWFIYEYLPGRDAAQVLASDGPLSLERTIAWMDPLLAALEFTHSRGIVVRDLRPRMVRLTEDGGKEKPVWTMLGLERMFEASPLSGLAGLANVTEHAAFLPPEFVTDYKNPTPAGDQYAAAALCYHFLTRKFVFDLPSKENRRFSVLLKMQVVPIRERRPDLPAAVCEVIERALRRQPSQRFGDIGEFRRALVSAI